MAGTRTAPTVDLEAASYIHVALTYIDRSGDTRTISDDFDADATAAEIETLVAAAVPMSQASIFEVSVEFKFVGAAISTNAEIGQRNSVFDQIIYRAKKAAGNLAYAWENPAPVAALMVGDTDQPVNPAALNTALFNALGPMKAGYAFKSIRFNEKKEQNKAVKI